MANETQLKIHCVQCSGSTNHDVVATEAVDESDEHMQWNNTYQIVRCRGCETYSFLHTSSSSEDWNPQTGEQEFTVKVYPDRASRRTPIDDNFDFPHRVRAIYHELITAFNSNSPILAAIGLRALIESVCVAEKTSGGNLEKRIDQLAIDGHLSAKQATILHSHRFLGNLAAHEIQAPKPLELIAALDIAETLLKTIYILPSLGASIKSGRK